LALEEELREIIRNYDPELENVVIDEVKENPDSSSGNGSLRFQILDSDRKDLGSNSFSQLSGGSGFRNKDNASQSSGMNSVNKSSTKNSVIISG
jgi:hypothetical protein